MELCRVGGVGNIYLFILASPGIGRSELVNTSKKSQVKEGIPRYSQNKIKSTDYFGQ